MVNVDEMNAFTIIPLNFRLADEGYSYNWDLRPYANYDNKKVMYSANRATYIVEAGALLENSDFTLSVSISNAADEEQSLPAEKRYRFKSAAGLEISNFGFTVEPQQGDAFKTEFTITMSNYTEINQEL